MKALLIGEYREGKLLDSTYELFGFAEQLGADTAMFLGREREPAAGLRRQTLSGRCSSCGEYNPDLHKQLILQAVEKENPDYIVFLHSSYGWDLAPRVAAALRAPRFPK